MTIFGYMCDVYCDIVYSNFVVVYVRIACAMQTNLKERKNAENGNVGLQ